MPRRGRVIPFPGSPRDPEPDGLTEVYRCDAAEAVVVKALFQSEGIPALLRSRLAHSVHPFTVGAQGEVVLMVPDREAARASLLLHRHRLTRAYDAFNARDIDAALREMHPDVAWPNGMEGGYVHGHEAVRAYWTRQWGMIDPRVEPQRFDTDGAGRVIVDVHQVVRDLAGAILSEGMVQHVYTIDAGLIRRMEIRTP